MFYFQVKKKVHKPARVFINIYELSSLLWSLATGFVFRSQTLDTRLSRRIKVI
jgi:hypothetical protein